VSHSLRAPSQFTMVKIRMAKTEDARRIKRKFLADWEHEKEKPDIIRIFKVFPKTKKEREQAKTHERYKERVGNVQMRYHGTDRVCSLGDETSDLELCDSSSESDWEECSQCRILENSINVKLAGRNARFGPGIYTTTVSSKAADYPKKSSNQYSDYRCILYCSVALGNEEKMYSRWDRTITGPSDGYDSVYGATKEEGGTLNYPENVVYKNKAICVKYMILYGRSDE